MGEGYTCPRLVARRGGDGMNKCVVCGEEIKFGTVMYHDYKLGDMHLYCKKKLNEGMEVTA